MEQWRERERKNDKVMPAAKLFARRCTEKRVDEGRRRENEDQAYKLYRTATPGQKTIQTILKTLITYD